MSGSIEAEQWHIARFLQLLSEEVIGEIRSPNPPDAVVRLSEGEVAIEHTRIRLPNRGRFNPSAYENRMKRVVQEAQSLFEARCNDRVRVGLDFDDRVILRPDEGAKLARVLADLVEAHKPTAGGSIRLDAWWFGVRGGSPPHGIETIWIDSDAADESFWYASGGVTVPRLSVERVQSAIDEKAKKLASYRAVCPKVWLLLVIGDSFVSGYWDIHSFPMEHRFASEFSRVFLYEQFKAHVVELQVSEAEERG